MLQGTAPAKVPINKTKAEQATATKIQTSPRQTKAARLVRDVPPPTNQRRKTPILHETTTHDPINQTPTQTRVWFCC